MNIFNNPTVLCGKLNYYLGKTIYDDFECNESQLEIYFNKLSQNKPLYVLS